MYYTGKISIFRFSALCICFTKDLQSCRMEKRLRKLHVVIKDLSNLPDSREKNQSIYMLESAKPQGL